MESSLVSGRHLVVDTVMQAYDALMRTTVDLPEDPRPDQPLEIDPETGPGLFRIGRPITSDEVQAFLHDED